MLRESRLRWESDGLLEKLSVPKAVVKLAEEAVQQVPLCGGMPVTMLASAPVVCVRSR